MSPLKKFNRVVPSSGLSAPSVKKSLELEEGNVSLKSSSATLLDQKSGTPKTKERPDSAPLKDAQSARRSKQQLPIDARVVIKTNNDGGKKLLNGVVVVH